LAPSIEVTPDATFCPDGRRGARTGATGCEESRPKRQAGGLRPHEKSLHGLILSNPLTAPKELLKPGLQNHEGSMRFMALDGTEIPFGQK
jgi:hypothetical protein